jgi:enoyl-CoA hydratase/carnithine racemase
MGELVRLEDDTAPGVVTVRLDNGRMNPISKQVTAELTEVVGELEGREDIGAVVLWGGPNIFAAGADINEFPEIEDKAAAVEFSMSLNRVLLRFEALPQITIAAVNGYALGGGTELAMTPEFRLAGESAVFGQPEILLGIIPGGGGTQRLPRLVGVTRAKEIIYSGRMVNADEALEIGLVSGVHPDEEVYPEAVRMAERYASGPKALQYAKQSIMAGMHLQLADAVEAEAEAFGDCFGTEDRKTGVQSFIEHGPGKATFERR